MGRCWVLFLTCCLFICKEVGGHGRLIEPPSRSSMWRYGFNTTANYNDHEQYCGGFSRQYERNGGKCGVCGDSYDTKQPRPNEAGGTYGQGIIVRQYRQNSIIRIKVELTANHKGYFEFRLCPNNNVKKIVSQKCLDSYLLQQGNKEGPRFYPGEGTKVFEARYFLPKDLTCTQCVLQWRYIAANNWGNCENGTEAIGCGHQEEFRACADVGIYDRAGNANSEETEQDVETNEIDHETPNAPDETRHEIEPLEPESVVWPFIMALIAFFLAVVFFGVLLGWFYRKKVVQYGEEIIDMFHEWKGGDSRRAPVPPPRNKKIILRNDNHRKITPDIISQPMQVTINGFAV